MIAGTVVRRRRLALGLSTRDVGRRLGVTAGVVERLEHDRPTEITLAQTARLADALGVPVSSLLAKQGAVARSADNDTVRCVGACLAEAAGRPIHYRDIARRCGIDLDDVRPILKQLADRLDPAGLTLSYEPRSVTLAPADLGPLPVTFVSLSPLDLALLAEASRGPVTLHQVSAGWRKVAATRLLRDGMINPTDRGLELTPDIAASLAFGEPLKPN